MASAGAAHNSPSTATALRRLFAGATLIVLAAACVAVAVNRSSYDAPNALLSGGKGVSITKGAQALAFGDADGFKSSKTAEVTEPLLAKSFAQKTCVLIDHARQRPCRQSL